MMKNIGLWILVMTLASCGGVNTQQVKSDAKTVEDLTFAAMVGRLDLVKSILDSGVGVNDLDDSENAVLHAAIMGNEYEISEYVVGKGADVNLQTNRAYRPLFLLCSMSGDVTSENAAHMKIAKLLVKAGADVTLQSDGYTLIEKCEKDGAPDEMVNYLKSQGAE